jgi:multimeric flavodoxin WrbA
MKILGVNASHREKSNSEAFLNYVLSRLQKTNQTKQINLREMSLKHCDGCGKCEISNECEIKSDDMMCIYEEMKNADVIIFSTPTYFGMPSGLLKVVMDRTNAFFAQKQLKGKYGSVIVNGAGNPGGIELNAKNCQHFFYDHGMMTLPFYVCITESHNQPQQRFESPFSDHIKLALEQLCKEVEMLKKG